MHHLLLGNMKLMFPKFFFLLLFLEEQDYSNNEEYLKSVKGRTVCVFSVKKKCVFYTNALL